MARRWLFLSVVSSLFLCFSTCARAEVRTERIAYEEGGASLEGFLAFDDAIVQEGSLSSVPGILIVHQWMGSTAYEEGRARQLAGLGYVAFALDVYGVLHRPKTREDAGRMAGAFKKDRKLFRRRLLAGLGAFRKRTGHAEGDVAAIGYCFGGTGVLELARTGVPIAGVASFHGGLDSPAPEDGKRIKARVLVCHGGADPFVPEADIAAFRSEMEQGGVDWQMVSYGHAVHAFTQPMAGNDPTSGAAHDPAADRRSWAHMRLFFDEIFAR